MYLCACTFVTLEIVSTNENEILIYCLLGTNYRYHYSMLYLIQLIRFIFLCYKKLSRIKQCMLVVIRLRPYFLTAVRLLMLCMWGQLVNIPV